MSKGFEEAAPKLLLCRMIARHTSGQILRFLGGRLARNVYLWTALLYLAITTNINNERAYHWGIPQSRWYWPVLIAGLLLQMALVYINNLLLVPRLLARKRILTYLVCSLSFVVIVSVIYALGLRLAAAHFRVGDMQQIGMVTGPVADSWSWRAMADSSFTYILGNAMWVFLLTMAWYMNDYARQKRLAEEALRRQAETEMAFLKSQLNPHFLFNTLNNVYALSLRKSDATPESILKLSSILRYLLYESNSAVVSFEREREIMEAYIDLELLRLKDSSGLHFDISADRDYQLAPLLWLPVLENIFKHGTRTINEDAVVSFRFRIERDVLQLNASNSFKNGHAAAPGIGLANLEKRLQLLYPGRHEFTSKSHGHTFTTQLKIKLA